MSSHTLHSTNYNVIKVRSMYVILPVIPWSKVDCGVSNMLCDSLLQASHWRWRTHQMETLEHELPRSTDIPLPVYFFAAFYFQIRLILFQLFTDSSHIQVSLSSPCGHARNSIIFSNQHFTYTVTTLICFEQKIHFTHTSRVTETIHFCWDVIRSERKRERERERERERGWDG